MKATYQHTKGERPVMWIKYDEVEESKAEKIASKMGEYGYEIIHKDSGESIMLTHYDRELPIKQMKEDYKCGKVETK